MQIIEKKITWEGEFLRFLLLTYKDKLGKLRNWEAIERVNCYGIVAVVPITTNGELLLIRQFRPVVNNFVIEFPAGLNDRKEDIIETAKRELIEETGYTAKEFIFLAKGPLSSGMSTEIMTVFLARDAFLAPSQLRQRHPTEETESIEIIKTSLSAINKVLEGFQKKGDYIDLKIYGLIELAKKYLH